MFSIFKKNNAGSETLINSIKNGALLLDVRTPSEFADGHVPNSLNIPLDRLDVELDRLRDAKEIVVYCLSGGRSSQAMQFLNRKGFDNVINGQTWRNVKSIVDSI